VLADALAANTAITSLNLEHNNLGDDGAAAIAGAIKYTLITTVNLSHNKIGPSGAGFLADALLENTAITALNLASNSIGPNGASYLAEALKVNTAVTTLDLSDNNVGPVGAVVLADVLLENMVITALNLASNAIGPDGAGLLAEALKVNTVVSTLDLSGNNIGFAGAVVLADGLKKNMAITALNLASNAIGPDGAGLLAEALKVNTVLSTLDLSDNFIGPAGAIALAESLKVNTAVSIVKLGFNTIGDAGAASLAEAFKVNTAITTVNLENNSIGLEWSDAVTWLVVNAKIRSVDQCSGAGIISQATGTCECSKVSVLEVGRTCSDLVAAECFAKDIGLAQLHEGKTRLLVIPSRCRTLDLRSNNVSDADAVALAKALERTVTLSTVDLSNNVFGDVGAAALVEALKANSAISNVQLGFGNADERWIFAIKWLTQSKNRSTAVCSGAGVLLPISGECQCSGLVLLGTGPTCSDVVCSGADVGLTEYLGGGSLTIPSRCTQLNLRDSNLFNEGAAALAQLLLHNTAITMVSLGSNGIGDRGAGSLAEALETNTAIVALDLSQNLIGEQGAARLAEALVINLAITSIDLSGNTLGAAWVSVFGCYSQVTHFEGKPVCADHSPSDVKSATLAGAVIAGIATVGIAFGSVLLVRRRRGSAVSVTFASKFVAVARDRAEARFVLEYRQLVQAKTMAEFQRELQLLEVPRSSISLGAELGRGQSGVVLRGVFSKQSIELAVKTRADIGLAVGGAAAVADEALMLEAMLLNGLRHPGIVSLIAVVTTGAPVLVCTELMANGDLRGYLRACRPSQRRSVPTTANGGQQHATISPQVMVTMAATIGSAMAFLEQQSIIHRDIAARNVLVGRTASDVKMADLGAARNVHRTRELAYSGVYRATTDHTPARWMALEALREAKFSHKSDVFAFGVLIWEILTLGQTPWGAFGVPDFTQALTNGERLNFPPALERDFGDAESRSATNLYAIAVRCWKEDPTKRPHFHQLEAELAVHCRVLAAAGAVAPAGDSIEGGGGRQQHVGADGGLQSKTSEIGLRLPVQNGGGSVADLGTAHQPSHANGHVADVGAGCQSYLDSDGYVADTGASYQPDLDGNGYVADTPLQNADLSAQANTWSDGLATNDAAAESAGTGFHDAFLEDEPSILSLSASDASVARPRNGIAARSARNRSLYLGFESTPASGVGGHDDETRL
jgi:serine/threonine protein kinase/Ran GTPase-activating protein (RanGAP) involved in mRNA processing and transport